MSVKTQRRLKKKKQPESRFSTRKPYLEDVLVFSVIAECVLAPAGRPAPLSREVRERVWQAGRADVRVSGKVDGFVHAKYSQVVVQRARVEFSVYDQTDDVRFHVRVEFHVVVYVPFAQTNAQVLFVVTACVCEKSVEIND